MASFYVEGLDGLEEMFANIAAMPESVLDEMLDVQADIVVEAQKKTAGSMLQGPYNEGAVADSVTKGKFKRTAGGGIREVTFKGTQHGNRLAEIAFVNEYGTKSQPARPFIETANEECADEAADAAADVFDKHLGSI